MPQILHTRFRQAISVPPCAGVMKRLSWRCLGAANGPRTPRAQSTSARRAGGRAAAPARGAGGGARGRGAAAARPRLPAPAPARPGVHRARADGAGVGRRLGLQPPGPLRSAGRQPRTDGCASAAPRVARVGIAVGTFCLTLLDWTRHGRDARGSRCSIRRCRSCAFASSTPTSTARTARKRVTGTLWDWVKTSVHPRLEAVTVDLGQPLAELRAFLPLVLPRRERRADGAPARVAVARRRARRRDRV